MLSYKFYHSNAFTCEIFFTSQQVQSYKYVNKINRSFIWWPHSQFYSTFFSVPLYSTCKRCSSQTRGKWVHQVPISTSHYSTKQLKIKNYNNISHEVVIHYKNCTNSKLKVITSKTVKKIELFWSHKMCDMGGRIKKTISLLKFYIGTDIMWTYK